LAKKEFFYIIIYMPIYLYRVEKGSKGCKLCKKGLEVLQKVGEEPLKRCPKCGSKLKKVFSTFSLGFSKTGLERRAKEAGFHKLKRVDKGKYEKLY